MGIRERKGTIHDPVECQCGAKSGSVKEKVCLWLNVGSNSFRVGGRYEDWMNVNRKDELLTVPLRDN